VLIEDTPVGFGAGAQPVQACPVRGARTMVTTVLAQRGELIAWYERRGFRRTGEARPFPYGDARFGLPKRPDLSFVVLAKTLPSG
jgi:hypothetical protein